MEMVIGKINDLYTSLLKDEEELKAMVQKAVDAERDNKAQLDVIIAREKDVKIREDKLKEYDDFEKARADLKEALARLAIDKKKLAEDKEAFVKEVTENRKETNKSLKELDELKDVFAIKNKKCDNLAKELEEKVEELKAKMAKLGL